MTEKTTPTIYTAESFLKMNRHLEGPVCGFGANKSEDIPVVLIALMEFAQKHCDDEEMEGAAFSLMIAPKRGND